jgi:hypothetical protein
LKISGVEKLGSTSVVLLSEFTGVAWKPVGELYWVMLEWVLDDPAVPPPPFLPSLASFYVSDRLGIFSPWNTTW